MTEGSKNLIVHGFLSDEGKGMFEGMDLEARREKAEKLIAEGKNVEEYASHDEIEISNDQMLISDYPKPISHYRLQYETFSRPLESVYFWCLNHFHDLGFIKIDKIIDAFAAAEMSSAYGSASQRMGLHQDKVGGYLRAIGQMVKELFQIVREMRIIDERLEYYEHSSQTKDEKLREAAEIALKGLFVDFAEGGAKNASSVFGMAQQLQFTTLPELFFSTHPRNEEDIAKIVEKIEYANVKVKEVLMRKLYNYLRWKKETHREIKNRRDHTLKYLRQHYEVIQLYMNWIKPYLQHIQRLSPSMRTMKESADIVAAFESTVIEIEVLAQQIPKGNTDFYTCILLNLSYKTSPEMPFQTDYQRGPVYKGKIDVIWRSYVWTEKEIRAYKEMKEQETLEALGMVDISIQQAMDSLGDDLQKYLKEAGAKYKKEESSKKEEAVPQEDALTPFVSIFRGFGEIFDAFHPAGKKRPIIEWVMDPFKSEAKAKAKSREKEKGAAAGLARALCWTHYNNFKKAHRMLSW